jgi:hypothetical protein
MVIESTVESETSDFALSGFGASLRRVRCLAFAQIRAIIANALPNAVCDAFQEASTSVGLSDWATVDEAPDDLAGAAGSNDIAIVGRRLGPRDVNAVSFSKKELPGLLLRRPFECSLLDVAVGSGSVEMTKYLLEFRRARPGRETLRQSISTGNLELNKLLRERLPERELRDRVDLMEVAAEFHQEDVLVWLLRDATVFERELLGVFAIERKLADSFVVALGNGFHPWWLRTREVSLKWRASVTMDFVLAPEGFSSDGGWWTSVSGVTSALRGRGSETRLGPTLPDGTLRPHSAVEFKWTTATSRAQLGDAKLVK